MVEPMAYKTAEQWKKREQKLSNTEKRHREQSTQMEEMQAKKKHRSHNIRTTLTWH